MDILIGDKVYNVRQCAIQLEDGTPLWFSEDQSIPHPAPLVTKPKKERKPRQKKETTAKPAAKSGSGRRFFRNSNSDPINIPLDECFGVVDYQGSKEVKTFAIHEIIKQGESIKYRLLYIQRAEGDDRTKDRAFHPSGGFIGTPEKILKVEMFQVAK